MASTEQPAPSGEALPELPLFSAAEAFVYKVPMATTSGHRAELWDVNNWLATVSLRVMQADDDAFIRLLDDKTGELFAECPVPRDKPLVTAVEPVVDSSRYYVLRIVDRDSQRHAFIGIGFRERSEASDFNAALHEFLQYIKRKRTAEAMRHAYQERLAAAAAAGEGGGAGGGSDGVGASPVAPLPDYSLKEGETLKLSFRATKPAGSGGGFVSSAGAGGGRRGVLSKTFSLLMDGHGGTVAALSPPPPSSSGAGGGSPQMEPRHDMSVSPKPRPGLETWGSRPGPAQPRLSGDGGAALHDRLAGMHLGGAGAAAAAGQQQQHGQQASASASVASSSLATSGVEDDDEFGELIGADSSAAESLAAQQPASAAATAGSAAAAAGEAPQAP